MSEQPKQDVHALNSKDINENPIWVPNEERKANAQITHYLEWLKETRGIEFNHYEALWEWSTTDLEGFWESIWDYGGVISHSPYQRVLNQHQMPGARWFEGATLNYAEHILTHANNPSMVEQAAIIAESETRQRMVLSWRELNDQTAALAAWLRADGLTPGARVAAYMPNIPETIVAILAAASCGAIWSAASPDMGSAGVVDRFRQIEPEVLFAVDGYRYGGKDYDRCNIVRELIEQLPSLRTVVFLPYLNFDADITAITRGAGDGFKMVQFSDTLLKPGAPKFEALPFDYPLWIVYSSGTTGMPKPIIHCHGGVVLQNCKAAIAHTDTKPLDRAFWFTSTSWIMWNSVVSTLQSGATVLLFDGNPGYPDLTTLWRFVEREKATSFGTSPAFISLCQKAGISPRDQFDLSSLKTVGSTGSPLTEDGYRWVYEHVHPDVMLLCISGGTDPGACFLTGSPVLPIYAGEMTCRELGVSTQAFDEEGNAVMAEVGELVMTKPIPSMPTGFWGDTDGKRYFESYFDTYPGVWCHGDWLQLNERPHSVTGIIFGRSDATINRHGIRMGSSEIYRIVEEFSEIRDSLVVDLEYLGKPSYLALFVVLEESLTAAVDANLAGVASNQGAPGENETGISKSLRTALIEAIRTRLSARHTPNEIFAVPAVPRTLSGKKMEVPVKKILLGKSPESSVNTASMANPESVDWYIRFAEGRNK